MDLPLALLLHRVRVEPYRSWGVYDPPYTLKCVVNEQIAARLGQAGLAQTSTISIYARKKTDCPPGSKITLADGRVGYAVAIVRYDGGGLPTPDHVEIAANVAAPFYSPAFGETVVLKRAVLPIQDRYGNTRLRYTDVVVPECAVRVMSSSEQATNTADQVSINIEVVMPPDVVVTAQDRMLVRGLLFEVNGEPIPVQDSMTGANVGQRVVGLRQTG